MEPLSAADFVPKWTADEEVQPETKEEGRRSKFLGIFGLGNRKEG